MARPNDVAAIVAAVIAGSDAWTPGGFVGGGGGATIPDVAVQYDAPSDTYQIFSGNTDTPDAYFNDVSGVPTLQTGVSSGYVMTVDSSGPYPRVILSTP